MNVYTSDGLLVRGATETGALSAWQGQQLISIYRLFLQLHHAGTGTMRIKDMMKPEATDVAGEHGGGGAGGDRNADRRGGGAGRGASGAVNANWNSLLPSMLETTAYTSSIAVVSAGTPYPMFLLSSNAIPETHRLRGFASAAGAPQQQQQHTAATTAATKNKNRSANGCEEIAVRWSLLVKQRSPCPSAAVASAAAGAATASPAGAPTSVTTKVSATAAKDAKTQVGEDTAVGRVCVMSERPFSMPSMASADDVSSVAPAATTTARTAAVAPCAHPFGWTAAELQVHTTKQVMVCTATELPLDLSGGAEDGNSPLLFCCSTHPASA
ncbi:hypothetical protein LSCM1_06857 [Leishmania martiniquensis]|uniref:Uncharacterized protein n=1 Tax=Leishmania martiniquensis TaxID=1580590 RepID=A0A836KQ91_9TRYP|nr:hypothetical protein LSCM1_06857 [Leishmania martiniquensis]